MTNHAVDVILSSISQCFGAFAFYRTVPLTKCGLHNKVMVAQLLMDIANQQSEELKVIE